MVDKPVSPYTCERMNVREGGWVGVGDCGGGVCHAMGCMRRDAIDRLDRTGLAGVLCYAMVCLSCSRVDAWAESSPLARHTFVVCVCVRLTDWL